jgi:hypothetical protein
MSNTMHRDVVLTIMGDLIARRQRRELSSYQFDEEAAPLLAAYMESLQAEQKASREEFNRVTKDIHARLSDIELQCESYKRDSRDFNDFLKLKGLETEFDQWLWERMQEDGEADQQSE